MRNEEIKTTTIHDIRQQYVSSEVRFYTVDDVARMSGWSTHTVLRLFADPDFPSADFGKAKIVEAHALIDYFSKKRSKDTERYWKKGDLTDELRKRLR